MAVVATREQAPPRYCPGCGAPQQHRHTHSCDYCTSPLLPMGTPDPRHSRPCPSCWSLEVASAKFCRSCGESIQFVERMQVELSCPGCETVSLSDWTGQPGFGAANDDGEQSESNSWGTPANTEVSNRTDVSILGCHQCAGIWLDQSTLLALQRDARVESQLQIAMTPMRSAPVRYGLAEGFVQQPIRYRKCPECNLMMSRRNYAHSSGIILDSCPQHGTFFDSGELPAILKFVRSGGLEVENKIAKSDESSRFADEMYRFDRSFQVDRLKDLSLSELIYDIVFPLAVWMLHRYRVIVRLISRH